MSLREEELKEIYQLEAHVEGGSFSEVYVSSREADGRELGGSIYFLLGAGEVSRFHQIDCDEIWFYHEGCGMRITVLTETGKKEFLLGKNAERDERAMVVIPEGSIFGAENLEDDGYTFVSCVTIPQFRYEGFRLVGKEEIREKYSDIADEIEHLAYVKQ